MFLSKLNDQNFISSQCPRCSFPKFLLWLGFLGIFLALGLFACFLVLRFGLGETNLDNSFGFGLWISFDLAVIALGAGAFFTGLLRYLFNLKELDCVVNFAVVLGFLCYTGALIVLGLDIGQPLRAWYGYWYANVHSMLTEIFFCLSCYCLILIIEYIPIILEQRQLYKSKLVQNFAHNFHIIMPLFVAIGAFLSVFHQGSLGGMYGVMFARVYAFREGFFIWPTTFFLFILSAVATGPLFTILIASLMEKITKRKFIPEHVKRLLAKIAAFFLCFYTLFKLIDTWYWAEELLPAFGYKFSQMFYHIFYGQWLLWLEIIACAAIPAILLLFKYYRNKPIILYSAAIFACLGTVINRYTQTVQTIAVPSFSFEPWIFYLPNWVEWAATGLVIAYAAFILSLSYRYLNLFPKEQELN